VQARLADDAGPVVFRLASKRRITSSQKLSGSACRRSKMKLPGFTSRMVCRGTMERSNGATADMPGTSRLADAALSAAALAAATRRRRQR